MGIIKQAIVAGTASALLATPVPAQQSERSRVSKECRQEIRTLCASDGERDRKKIRACVRENMSSLSEGCAAEIKQRMQERRAKKHEDSGSN